MQSSSSAASTTTTTDATTSTQSTTLAGGKGLCDAERRQLTFDETQLLRDVGAIEVKQQQFNQWLSQYREAMDAFQTGLDADARLRGACLPYRNNTRAQQLSSQCKAALFRSQGCNLPQPSTDFVSAANAPGATLRSLVDKAHAMAIAVSPDARAQCYTSDTAASNYKSTNAPKNVAPFEYRYDELMVSGSGSNNNDASGNNNNNNDVFNTVFQVSGVTSADSCRQRCADSDQCTVFAFDGSGTNKKCWHWKTDQVFGAAQREWQDVLASGPSAGSTTGRAVSVMQPYQHLLRARQLHAQLNTLGDEIHRDLLEVERKMKSAAFQQYQQCFQRAFDASYRQLMSEQQKLKQSMEEYGTANEDWRARSTKIDQHRYHWMLLAGVGLFLIFFVLLGEGFSRVGEAAAVTAVAAPYELDSFQSPTTLSSFGSDTNSLLMRGGRGGGKGPRKAGEMRRARWMTTGALSLLAIAGIYVGFTWPH